jgi:hypothetical protein
MDSINKPFSGYANGTDAWRDNVLSYGIDEAITINRRYLDMQLKFEVSDDEKQFCREIFAAMYEATANKVVPAKLVYPYDFKTANDRWERCCFDRNREMNQECARAIGEAISASCYKTNFYNLELAAMSVINGHGFQRVNAVLAHQIQKHEYDGRYSTANKRWARDFIIPDKSHVFLNPHAILIDGFTTYTRKLYEDLGAERFALLGREEHGESEPVQWYDIIRSIMFNETEGYVIAHNPDGCDPYVCWKLSVSADGERRYDWGIYGEERAAIDAYNARLFKEFN